MKQWRLNIFFPLIDLSPVGCDNSVFKETNLTGKQTNKATRLFVYNINIFLDENVLWTLFNGESFDYIGSQRVAYDIARGVWPPISPLSPKDISLHIELGQLGGSLKLFKENISWPLYAFAPYENVYPDQVCYLLVTKSKYLLFVNWR